MPLGTSRMVDSYERFKMTNVCLKISCQPWYSKDIILIAKEKTSDLSEKKLSPKRFFVNKIMRVIVNFSPA